MMGQEGNQVDGAASVQHPPSVLEWHLRELGGVRENDNRFVAAKELSRKRVNSAEVWHSDDTTANQGETSNVLH